MFFLTPKLLLAKSFYQYSFVFTCFYISVEVWTMLLLFTCCLTVDFELYIILAGGRLTFIECLLCIRHCFMFFSVISFWLAIIIMLC
jgi:hypothetical protein